MNSMNSTPTTIHQIVLFYRQQKELREINSAQENENQQQNSKGGKMEQVYGIKNSTCICSPMEIRLSNWIMEKRESGISISGFQIKLRAIEIYNEIHPNENTETERNAGATSNQMALTTACELPWVEFKASDGWLSNFCTRRGYVLRRVSSCGRELPKDCLNIMFKFYSDLTKIIQDNSCKKGQILNIDESCQYLDAPSQYTYAVKGAKRTVVYTTGAEKTRLSGAWTGAADGKKLPIYLIIPRVNELPNFHVPNNVMVTYRSDSIFNTETIISYAQRIVLPYKISQNYDKILLIIDSARCHLTAQVESFCVENGISLFFVPPGLTNMLQPADVSWFASRPQQQKH
ncbi:Pogo transposable element with [Brachionus plicatilis]|uniref:Pogo transposable element with n=1 Tax=Brachionus plicatilis TaxID=10195 RepID=A0A3M7Q3Q1_BRAPC|nr:Pogo transposable element with [Brachionus plicatilis]